MEGISSSLVRGITRCGAPMQASRRTLLPVFTAVVLFMCLGASPLRAQSLIEMYRNARFQAQAQQVFDEHGLAAKPMPVDWVPYVSDSMRAHMARFFPPEIEPPAPPRLEIREWQLIPKLGRSWFERNYGADGWSFLGNNAMTRLDTTFTREIRARLESEFGTPTQTIADLEESENLPLGDLIQFEYWFVLNDSIPLRVMDVNGPLERGVVVASEQKYRHLLPELRDRLDVHLLEHAGRAPYADYYYLPDQRMWFITGFDGRRYFLNRISKPNLRLGRPLLEKVLDS